MAENTPEKIAFDLMERIAGAEDKRLVGADKNADRAWILRTYAQCLETVKNPNVVQDHLAAFTG